MIGLAAGGGSAESLVIGIGGDELGLGRTARENLIHVVGARRAVYEFDPSDVLIPWCLKSLTSGDRDVWGPPVGSQGGH